MRLDQFLDDGQAQARARGFGREIGIENAPQAFRRDALARTRTEEARITVSRGGKPVGVLTPQRLTYRNYDHPHTEVSTVPGLGDEPYATVHDLDGERLMPLKVSVNPLVNWVWIGSILVCLLPLLAFRLNPGRTSPKGGAA